MRVFGVALVVLAAMAGSAVAQDPAQDLVRPDVPRTVGLTITSGGQRESLTGDVVSLDATGCTLHVRGEIRRFAWHEVTPASAFSVRHRLIDEEDAWQWLDLGRFGRRVGAESLADFALRRAVALSPACQQAAEEAKLIPLGAYREAAVLGRPALEDDRELVDRATAEADQVKLRLRTFRHGRFRVFTAADPGDDHWIRRELEEAQQRLAEAFELEPQDAFGPRPLAVYVFASMSDMRKYAREIDGLNVSTKNMAGYFAAHRDGQGELLRSKIILPTPTAGVTMDFETAKQRWRRTLTHEMTHAVSASFLGDRPLPRWLEEGLAEMLAERVWPRTGALERAKSRSQTGLGRLLEDDYMPTADDYPVVMTLVKGIHREDPARFATFLKRLKSGDDAEALMVELYGADFDEVDRAWRDWMRRQ